MAWSFLFSEVLMIKYLILSRFFFYYIDYGRCKKKLNLMARLQGNELISVINSFYQSSLYVIIRVLYLKINVPHYFFFCFVYMFKKICY